MSMLSSLGHDSLASLLSFSKIIDVLPSFCYSESFNNSPSLKYCLQFGLLTAGNCNSATSVEVAGLYYYFAKSNSGIFKNEFLIETNFVLIRFFGFYFISFSIFYLADSPPN